MPPTTRFAPSPTGRLHLGHAASAIRAHDFARLAGGTFLLRIEDIDPGRSRADHIETILEDMGWLGLAWDGPVLHQSTRLPAYAAALDRLRAQDLLYPCTCTRAEIAAEIAASATAPHGPAPVYPGTCRTRARAMDGDRPERTAAWRLRMDHAVALAGPLDWHDATAGTVLATPQAQGDIVLARRDAPASYHLAVTLDDAHQGVTDVVRGIDLFDATHIHRLLQALLGLPTPSYHHHPLAHGPDGRRLAKRDGAPALADLRAAGSDGPALADSIRRDIMPHWQAPAEGLASPPCRPSSPS